MLSLLASLALSAPVYSIVATDPALVRPEPALGPAALTFAPSDDMPEMEYTYIEANALWTDSDAADETLGGVELIGSLELPMNFFAQVTVAHQDNSADLDTFRLGAGYHLPLTSRFDAYGILSFAHAELDGTGIDSKDDGLAGELGLRMLLTPKIELNGRATWVDLGDSDYGVGFGARYYLTDSISLGGRIETLDSDESFAAGLRIEF